MPTTVTVYLDESGDLGWKFDKPYRKGGSSRYLTISAVILPQDKSHLPGKLIRKLYKKFKWQTNREQKWWLMNEEQKNVFCTSCVKLIQNHHDISYHSITVYKPNVQQHIRNDPNKLYNYMIGLMLVDKLTEFEIVNFIPDPRTIKVKSGNSLSDYMQTQLWFEKKVSTTLENKPQNSSRCKGVQYADMLSGVIQQHFEDQSTQRFEKVEKLTDIKKLYFPI